MCGIQHLQRAGSQQFDLFNSLWYVVVTFSTVGYGDFAPDIWPSKLFMIILIGTAFVVLPTQVRNTHCVTNSYCMDEFMWLCDTDVYNDWTRFTSDCT